MPKDFRILHPAADAAAKFREALKLSDAFPLRFGDELVNPPPVPVCGKWLYPGRLSSLTGEPGAGKGWVLARTEAAVLLGETFPGPRAAQPRSVLHVNRDDICDQKWQSLFEKMPGLYEVAREHLGMYEPPRAFQADQVLPVFLEAADRIHQARPAFCHEGALIVVDTFRTFAAIEENSSQEVSEFLSALREVTAASGPFPAGALWISHHTPWQQVGVEAHERGSSAFRGDIDEPLMVRNLRQERARQEQHNKWQRLKGYRVNPLPPLATTRPVISVSRLKGKLAELDPLAPDVHTFTLESVPLTTPTGFHNSAWLVPYDMSAEEVVEVSAERGREQRNEDDEAKVLEALASGPVRSRAALEKLTGLSDRRVGGALLTLSRTGRVQVPTHHGGSYRLVDGDMLTPED